MGKNKVISFEEEFKIVEDYLELEQVRYEERLKVEKNIDPASKSYQVPPLMIQTLVENGIKHGISKLTLGGLLKIETRIENNNLVIIILNSGQIIDGSESESGFGIKNTEERLRLLYGNSASLKIENRTDEFVKAELIIPSKLL